MRRAMRQKRRSLSSSVRRSASARLARVIGKLPLLARATQVAVYAASDGEPNTDALLSLLWERGAVCYLPVVHRRLPGRLQFAPVTPDSRFQSNRYGLPEPLGNGRLLGNTRRLDLVFVPLVAFDARGNRLGMGGGYYDRTFAWRNRGGVTRPVLIGLAHDFQEVESVGSDPWDVRLDWIVTDRRIIPITNVANHQRGQAPVP